MIELSTNQRQDFAEQGFIVLSDFAGEATVRALLAQSEGALDQLPVELEADTGYPGAPPDPRAPGGQTPRRLLQAYARGGALAKWAGDPRLVAALQSLLASPELWLSQAHHNCVMTKFPGYSSDTLWHQDIRYWSFRPPRLINAWLALGEEVPDNGGLRVIAGSHRWPHDAGRLDAEKFLRPELASNAAAIKAAQAVRLKAGDVLLFDAALFHSASRNNTSRTKLSVVYSYHGSDVMPVPGSRSASQPEIQVGKQ